jgi:GNAT superfamily N-acetyltransferase
MTIIRKAECCDLRQISYVHVDTWKVAYNGILDRDLLNKLSYGRSLENWRHCHEKLGGYFYVSEEEGRITGFIAGGNSRDEDLVYDAEIYAMYILPEFQRQLIGTRLLRQIAEDFKKEKWQQFLIWCLRNNPACAFYEAMGGELKETKRIHIGTKNLINNGYVFDTELFLKKDQLGLNSSN